MTRFVEAPKIHRIADRYEVTNEKALAYLDFSPEEIEDHIRWIKRCMADESSTFQKFLRRYFLDGVHLEKSLNRFALSVALVNRYCPKEGRWFDAGSIGHDAVRIKLIRPDIDVNLALFEGCIIYLDDRGLHYYEGEGKLPDAHVHCNKVDFEREPLNFDDNSLDIVSSFEVLEHYKFAPQKFCLEVNRVLKLNGRLLITTPNATSAAALNRIFRGLHPAECALYHRDLNYGRIHPLEYAQNQLSDLITAYGFEIDILTSINLTPFDGLELAAISEAVSFTEPFTDQSVSEFGQKWILIARKRSDVADFQYPQTVFE